MRQLYERYGGDDFIIIGFPANNFANQEPGTAEEIREFCAEHLADYKVPRFVEFVSSLPRSPAGKVIKDELRRT